MANIFQNHTGSGDNIGGVNKVVVNGKIYAGGSVVIGNGRVLINDEDVTPEAKVINIQCEGDLNSLKIDNCESVSINGNAGSVSVANGDVQISGSVMGNVSSTNGSVSCQDVSGNVSTINGDIKHRKS